MLNRLRHAGRGRELPDLAVVCIRSGVTRNVLIEVEQGRRGLLYERLFDLAEALEVPVRELVTGQGGDD